MNITVYADGYLQCGDKIFRAVYGRSGIGLKIREGDGVSPEGTWPLRQAFYRADKIITVPKTGIPILALTQDDVWCDIAGHQKYNQLIRKSDLSSDDLAKCEETLWREDDLYDVIVVIGYNDNPIIDGKGSAIFLHIARPWLETPTAGCAAVSKEDILEILPMLDSGSTLTFSSKTLKNEPIKWPYLSPKPPSCRT